MKQEDKQLLLVDLSARLPYGVKLKHTPTNEITTLEFMGKSTIDGDIHDIIENFSVYLYPLSSMTEEQRKEYHELLYNPKHGINIDYFDWCHKNHLDCRGLIKKGLAVDATSKNIY